jgi:ketosteroid isomerase-like protein
MSNESYQLTLNPITIETVNPETVFEIGQCEGSYNGKYILIWKKQTDGQWRIWVDSNI